MNEQMNIWTSFFNEIKRKRNNFQWERCLEIRVFYVCRCKYELLAKGPGGTPSEYFGRQYSPLKCVLTMDVWIFESLLVWVDVIIAIDVDHS